MCALSNYKQNMHYVHLSHDSWSTSCNECDIDILPVTHGFGVIGCRDIEDMPADPTNRWANKEFWVKWKRYSYIHCSWDTYATLHQLGGFKRVANYIRRVEEREAVQHLLSREERELLDVERQMEEQLTEQYKQVRCQGVGGHRRT